ncbi:uncharacterized protein LOC130156156 [Falco biarmicus]|uniref:uncharacterized protein LOC130156156 n=1 Tax=Falco biarmicus TaxID=345155 RepID=UPI0024BC346F|nr:uncharacterized protein LOC130156156 [Falco biarmicus]
MVEGNNTFTSMFILLGFTDRADLQMICFVLFLAVYVVTLMGNLGVIILIRTNSCLHTPMYFFLSHLSLLDICYSSTIIPQTLLNFLVEEKVISFIRCAAQLFSFATCATTECYVLAAMAYDRYMAICNPLLYSAVMSQRLCLGMLAGAYLAGVISSTIHTVSIFRLPFCRSKRINHFFCDGPPLLALSCSDTHVNEAIVSAVVGFNVLSTTVFILASYLSILSTVFRISSMADRHKAFSTCTSHLVSIALYYGSSLFMYLRPGSGRSLGHDEVVSMLYSVAVPMLNPLIYTLRNTDVKNTMRKSKGRVISALSTCGSWWAERRGLHCCGEEGLVLHLQEERLEMIGGENFTVLSGFILLGFSDAPELQTTIFTIFLCLYVLMVLGNLMIILLINTDPQLHTPMYFFLTHLSFVDFCLSSTVVPKALETFLLGRSHISFLGCLAQVYFFVALMICECFLLGVMAYDRYMAVCKPLLYTTAMSRVRCYGMMVLVYTMGLLSSLVHTILAGRLSFCRARSINHFFCELPTLLQLSCSDTRANQILQVFNAGLNAVGSSLMILVSYTYILHAALQIPLVRRRLKAFSTCTSHLVAITVFYVPAVLAYVQPHQASRWDQAKLASVCYTTLTPTLNPFIYSLRNKEVKGALRRLWVRKLVPHLSKL